MLSSTNLLLPALIFAVVGFLVGILVMSVFTDRSKRREKAASIEPVTENPILPETPVLPESRFESIAHIYREKTSGKIVTDVKGKVHLSHNTIPPEQLDGLREASRNWQNWLGLFEPPPAPAPRPVEPSPAAPLESAGAAAAPVIPAAPAAAPSTPPATSIPAAEPPVRPVPPVPVATAAPPARPIPVEKPRAKTMVGQIEEILQEMIPLSEYAGQEIHLTEDPTNGVIVWVGALKFTGINSVTDEGVKGLIQSAVRRWEDSGGTI